MAFRIHFTREDLLQVSFAPGPVPVLETVGSLRVVQQRRPGAAFGPWQRWARARIPRSVHLLRPLVQPHGACPDFLTPVDITDFDAGLEALLRTPKPVLQADLDAFTRCTGRRLPSWAGSLADGSPRTLEAVGRAVRDWHEAAIAPIRQDLYAQIEAARSAAARLLLDEGLDAMLSRLHHTVRWTPPVLELSCPDFDMDIHLEGRGLRLIPSVFCGREPAVNLDPGRPPVVVYPVRHDTIRTPEHTTSPQACRSTLAALLGDTRAAVLCAIAAGHGITTTDLAHRTGITPATVSHHTTVLRAAGLIHTRRAGPSAHHLATPLGARLSTTTQA